MILSMLGQRFAQFGTIENFEEKQKPMKLHQQEQVTLYCFDRDTYWDFETGMTALLILQDGEPVRFYLDRAIRILAGTIFGFYPMTDESSILTECEATDAVCGTYPIQKNSGQLNPMEIFARLPQSSRGGLYFRGERHKPMELVYVEKGTVYHYCEGQQIVLQPGQLLLIGSDQWHMQYSQEDVEELTVSFIWHGHDFSKHLCQCITATEDMRGYLQGLQRTVEHTDAEEYYQSQLRLLLISILHQPLRQDGRKSALPASQQGHRDVLDQAVQAVSAGVSQQLTVTKLAKTVNVSTSQLTSLFRTYLDTSPARYIARIRLEESKKMLAEEGLGVGEVARRLGYASVQHFSRQFHQWYGYTPTAYVKRQQKKPVDQ